MSNRTVDRRAPVLLVSLETHQLNHLSPEANRGREEGGFVGIDDGALPLQISLVGTDNLGALDDLPADVQDGRDNQHGIVGEESLDARRREAGVAVEEDDEGHAHEADIAAIRLEPASVGERVAVDALGLACAVEEDVRDAHDDVVDDASGGHEIDQPGQHLVGAVAQLQEGQEGECHDDAEAPDRDAVLGAFAEEARGASFNR